MMDDPARQRLIDALPKLKNRIQKIQNRRDNIGEQNTKAALIDPLLSALGWDVEDIDEVSREYKRKPQDYPVDYALFMLKSPRLFVEAKDLGKDLGDRKWISQSFPGLKLRSFPDSPPLGGRCLAPFRLEAS
jgi:hypothetical protein